MTFTVRVGSDDRDFYLTDQPDVISEWAREKCSSYKGYSYLDMSDVSSWSGKYDNYWVYVFEDEEDAFIFNLKFGN